MPKMNRHMDAAVRKQGEEIAGLIDSAIPEGYGFALLVFKYGKGGTMSWISNARRDDMIDALREMLHKFEAEKGYKEPMGERRN